ncbi:MAG: hypothetical protein U0930_02040 [Pirellulales bacterium]
MAEFDREIAPLALNRGIECHGSDTQEGNSASTRSTPTCKLVRRSRWIEIFAVVSKCGTPPPDSTAFDRSTADVMDWLSTELHAASLRARRQSASQSVFRRMTRYEFNWRVAGRSLAPSPDFAKDLPPEAKSSEGFRNTADQRNACNAACDLID